MRLFLDESAPGALKFRLQEHTVESVSSMGWRGIQNGQLLRLVDASDFEVFITADKNMKYQQQMAHLKFATLVLSTNHWPTVRSSLQSIRDALTDAKPGTVVHVSCGDFKPQKRDA